MNLSKIILNQFNKMDTETMSVLGNNFKNENFTYIFSGKISKCIVNENVAKQKNSNFYKLDKLNMVANINNDVPGICNNKWGDHLVSESLNICENMIGLLPCYKSPNSVLNYQGNIKEFKKESNEFKNIASNYLNNVIPVAAMEDFNRKENIESDSDNSCGCNSSDFEFIDENEANKKGITVNTSMQIACNSNVDIQQGRRNSTAPYNNSFYVPSLSDYKGYKTYNYMQKTPLPQNENYQQHHIIPDGDEYLKLFQNGQPFNVLMAENKSTYVRIPRPFAFKGMSFAQILYKMHNMDTADDKLKQEAKETEEKLMSMYRENNTKHRRF